MAHPPVDRLRFTRSEFRRALAGVADADGRRRFARRNCIARTIGHLAWQEQRSWLCAGQGRLLLPHATPSSPPASRRSPTCGRPGAPSPRPPTPGSTR